MHAEMYRRRRYHCPRWARWCEEALLVLLVVGVCTLVWVNR